MAPRGPSVAPVKEKQKTRQTERREGLKLQGGTIGSTEEAAFISAPSRRIGERSPVPAADHHTASAHLACQSAIAARR